MGMNAMHTFIMLDNDIYTLDTVAERALAAEHMRDAGIERLPVYAGGPGSAEPQGRDFCADGTCGYDDSEEALARMTLAYRGES